ncbi:MAG: UvrB/UvrC motif-containing protein, partial [Alistipes sp.]|nr:UvrB/UvrC motif-containing protein [Candidatus Minthomonas equi]
VHNNTRNALDARLITDGYDSLNGQRRSRTLAEDPVISKMSPKELARAIDNMRQMMEKAAQELDFTSAAQYRDRMYELISLHP